jgi:NADP-dependent 3-hydroxy acid dehydrogenase YdfG
MDRIIAKDKEMTGKSVLITGGTTGIGRATAVNLAQKGASVFIFGRHEKELNDAIEDIRKAGGDAYGCTADVSHLDDIDRVFNEFDDQLGKMDILINNASIPGRSVVDTSIEEIQYLLNVNLIGYLLCARLAYQRMLKNGHGHIINVGSMSAHTRDEDTDLYVAAKSAIDGFNESFRKKANLDKIKVTIIEPGSVGTDLVTEPPKAQEEMEKELRLLKAEDIAECIFFCLSRPGRTDILRIQVKAHQQIF